jgi:hypothetical protein
MLNARERRIHGTSAYAQGCRCRCRRCRSDRQLADRERRALKRALKGQPVIYRTSTTALADHVAELRRHGWTLGDIATAAGLNVEAFRRALRSRRTISTTVERVLAVA